MKKSLVIFVQNHTFYIIHNHSPCIRYNVTYSSSLFTTMLLPTYWFHYFIINSIIFLPVLLLLHFYICLRSISFLPSKVSLKLTLLRCTTYYLKKVESPLYSTFTIYYFLYYQAIVPMFINVFLNYGKYQENIRWVEIHLIFSLRKKLIACIYKIYIYICGS